MTGPVSFVIPDGLQGRSGTAANAAVSGGPGSSLRCGRDDEKGDAA